MSTYVLVSGGLHGGWCWKRVVDRLRAHGHQVFAPTLTGLGERAHLFSAAVNLETHIADVMGVLVFEDLHDVILVGHSYGGMILTAIADRAPARVAQLVYLDAVWPENGESFAGMAGQDVALIDSAQPEHAIGTGVADADVYARLFGMTDPEDVAWVASKLTPQPPGSVTQPITLTQPDTDVPALFVSFGTTGYDVLTLSYNRAKARAKSDPRVRTLEVDTVHDAMITDPDLVADLLTAEIAIAP